MDYVRLKKKMVEEQLLPRGISDPGVLSAFYRIDRHRFVPPELETCAYADFPVSIGQGQTISQPYIVALMTQCLGLTGKEKVLEIGTGSGYQTAILAQLSAQTFSIERIEVLADKAKKLLGELGIENVKIKVGDGTLGWPEEAPFDRIIVTAASPRVPAPLFEQLKDSGKLIAPLGENFSQVMTLGEKKEGKFVFSEICSCVFVPLVGKYGWKG